MTGPSKFERFEELDAGRVLGDLDAAEWQEWNALAGELGHVTGSGLDLLAAELELALVPDSPPMPQHLAEKLRTNLRTPDEIKPLPDSQAIPRRRFQMVPWLGWGVAASLLGLMAYKEMGSTAALPAEQRRNALVKSAADIQKVGFKGTPGVYSEASGEVDWSDARQEGYMLLEHLPPNDSARQQYQLWIVDPERDEFPVDGGVFDIPSGGGSVVVPIAAKLAVRRPAAFVITLEKPGGVVRSKQEVVVAIAKF